CTCFSEGADRPQRPARRGPAPPPMEAGTMPETRPILFRGARVVDPAAGFDGVTDVLVADGVIAGVGEALGGREEETIDCSGLVLVPGLVDLHAHLREPGFEQKETIQTGTRAAAVGGFTAVSSMANTDPPTDHAA